MTRKNDTLWDHGMNCVTLLALAVINAPFIPYSIKRMLNLIIILILPLTLLFDFQKRLSYSEGELEREKRDERNRMIQMQAVWYCHVTEDWALLGSFAVCGFFIQNVVVTYVLLCLLVARSLLSFGIRWWLNRKY